MERKFEKFGTMLDLSRNAVMTVESLKKWMAISKDFGLNQLWMYMEDVYEIDGHPYFGYRRGRYSKAELKELDAYANEIGIELIPCIQTLGHLERIFRWPQYAKLCDRGNTILVDDEGTYALIEAMFETVSECFTTKTIHVGMDEATMLGRGKYYNLHGHVDHIEIMLKHMNRVSEIGKKYGYTVLIWSDMIYTMVTGEKGYLLPGCESAEVQRDVKDLIPDNMELVYWDYYSSNKERIDHMIQNHQKITDKLWFGGSLWTLCGFAPSNKYTIDFAKRSFASCMEHGVKNVALTAWGDNGAECSKFATLASFFYLSELAKGNEDEADIKAKFEEKFGIAFDDFMLIDLLDTEAEGIYSDYLDRNCPNKYVLYNDLFMGLMDTTIPASMGTSYEKMAEKLLPLCDHPAWGYLFDTLQKLCLVVAKKATLGQRIRKAYHSGDKIALQGCVEDAKATLPFIRDFYQAFRYQWMKENKPFGFEVHDTRIGGVLMRTENCIRTMEDYLAGKIDKIDQLHEELLDIKGRGAVWEEGYMDNACYEEIASVLEF